MREVNSLLRGLEPTLPVFLSNLVTVNQVLVTNKPALEQMLVVFPHVIAAGFTGTPGDGYGHINLQFNNNVPALHQGLQAAVPVAPGHRHHGRPGLPGEVQVRRHPDRTCAASTTRRSSGLPRPPAAPMVSRRTMRGQGKVDTGDGQSHGRRRRGGPHTVFGDDGWKWMLTGPVTADD